MESETGMSANILSEIPRIVSGEGSNMVNGREVHWEIKSKKDQKEGRSLLQAFSEGNDIGWLEMTDNERIHLWGSLYSAIALVNDFYDESSGGHQGIEKTITKKKIPTEVAEIIRARLYKNDSTGWTSLGNFIQNRINEDGIYFRYIKQ